MEKFVSPEKVYEICIIRKKYAVLDNTLEETQSHQEDTRKYSLSFAPPAMAMPELAKIEPFFERILVYQDGIYFNVLCFTSKARDILNPDLNKDTFLELGRDCADYTGVANGVKMPVNLELFYWHDGQSSPEIEEKLRNIKLNTLKQGIVVRPWTWNKLTGALWSPQAKVLEWINGAGWRKISRQAGSTDIQEEMRESAKAGFSIKSYVAGLFIGLLFAAGQRLGLSAMGVVDGKLFGLSDIFAGMIAVLVSIFAKKFRVSGIKQGIITALSYSAILNGVLIFLNNGVDFSVIAAVAWNSGVLCVLAYLFGKTSGSV